MQLIDLTHTLTEDMPLFPGTPRPKISRQRNFREHGFSETELSFFSHVGTHVDPPSHILPCGKNLDDLPLSAFAGKALVIDCRNVSEKEGITAQSIQARGEKIYGADFLLFHLGWDKKWGRDSYFDGYPCLTNDALEFLTGPHLSLKGVGFDAMGPDPVDEGEVPRHRALLGSGLVIVENLRGLALCGDDLFTFFALPLKWLGADGAPVRAAALLD